MAQIIYFFLFSFAFAITSLRPRRSLFDNGVVIQSQQNPEQERGSAFKVTVAIDSYKI